MGRGFTSPLPLPGTPQLPACSAPRRPQDAPKTAPGPSQDPPRSPLDPPRSPQDPPRSAQDPPRSPQDPQRPLKDPPRSLQDPRQDLQERPKGLPPGPSKNFQPPSKRDEIGGLGLPAPLASLGPGEQDRKDRKDRDIRKPSNPRPKYAALAGALDSHLREYGNIAEDIRSDDHGWDSISIGGRPHANDNFQTVPCVHRLARPRCAPRPWHTNGSLLRMPTLRKASEMIP